MASSKRSAHNSLLAMLSSRSSDRYLMEPADPGKPRAPAKTNAGQINNKKALPPGKKKRSASLATGNAASTAAAAVAVAYGSSPTKAKSSSKLLPRIAQ